MYQQITLTFTDGDEFSGVLSSFMAPPDQVAFERSFGVPLANFQDERRVEWILWLVWRAFVREQARSLTFDAFIEQLASYDMPADEDPMTCPGCGLAVTVATSVSGSALEAVVERPPAIEPQPA